VGERIDLRGRVLAPAGNAKKAERKEEKKAERKTKTGDGA
jgi:hypothetical protein